jgi:hypothetical protein
MSAFPHVALLVVQSTVATSTASSPSNAFPNSSHVGAKRLLHKYAKKSVRPQLLELFAAQVGSRMAERKREVRREELQ